MDALKSVNLAVRVLPELCAPAALANWGARTRSRLFTKVVSVLARPAAAGISTCGEVMTA
jgi:hypothetical protein